MMDALMQLQIMDFQFVRQKKMQAHVVHREPDEKGRGEVGSFYNRR
jgi:hypothetical protein